MIPSIGGSVHVLTAHASKSRSAVGFGRLQWSANIEVREAAENAATDERRVAAFDRWLSRRSRLSVEPLAAVCDDRMKTLAITVVALFIAGCGYLRSGNWEDDPGNWNRAFQSTKPADVVVVHSLYWRAPHWTFEAGYLFQIEPNEALRKQLFTKNRLSQVERSEIREEERPCFGKCPEWFVPEPIEVYEVWRYSDDPQSKFRIFIEKSTGRMFLGDYQV